MSVTRMLGRRIRHRPKLKHLLRFKPSPVKLIGADGYRHTVLGLLQKGRQHAVSARCHRNRRKSIDEPAGALSQPDTTICHSSKGKMPHRPASLVLEVPRTLASSLQDTLQAIPSPELPLIPTPSDQETLRTSPSLNLPPTPAAPYQDAPLAPTSFELPLTPASSLLDTPQTLPNSGPVSPQNLKNTLKGDLVANDILPFGMFSNHACVEGDEEAGTFLSPGTTRSRILDNGTCTSRAIPPRPKSTLSIATASSLGEGYRRKVSPLRIMKKKLPQGFTPILPPGVKAKTKPQQLKGDNDIANRSAIGVKSRAKSPMTLMPPTRASKILSLGQNSSFERNKRGLTLSSKRSKLEGVKECNYPISGYPNYKCPNNQPEEPCSPRRLPDCDHNNADSKVMMNCDEKMMTSKSQQKLFRESVRSKRTPSIFRQEVALCRVPNSLCLIENDCDHSWGVWSHTTSREEDIEEKCQNHEIATENLLFSRKTSTDVLPMATSIRFGHGKSKKKDTRKLSSYSSPSLFGKDSPKTKRPVGFDFNDTKKVPKMKKNQQCTDVDDSSSKHKNVNQFIMREKEEKYTSKQDLFSDKSFEWVQEVNKDTQTVGPGESFTENILPLTYPWDFQPIPADTPGCFNHVSSHGPRITLTSFLEEKECRVVSMANLDMSAERWSEGDMDDKNHPYCGDVRACMKPPNQSQTTCENEFNKAKPLQTFSSKPDYCPDCCQGNMKEFFSNQYNLGSIFATADTNTRGLEGQATISGLCEPFPAHLLRSQAYAMPPIWRTMDPMVGMDDSPSNCLFGKGGTAAPERTSSVNSTDSSLSHGNILRPSPHILCAWAATPQSNETHQELPVGQRWPGRYLTNAIDTSLAQKITKMPTIIEESDGDQDNGINADVRRTRKVAPYPRHLVELRERRQRKQESAQRAKDGILKEIKEENSPACKRNLCDKKRKPGNVFRGIAGSNPTKVNDIVESTSGNKRQQKNRLIEESFERNPVKPRTELVPTPSRSNKTKSFTPSPQTPVKNDNQPVQAASSPTKTNGMAESTGGNKKQQKNRLFEKSLERDSVKPKTESMQTPSRSNKTKSFTPSPKTPVKNDNQPVQAASSPKKTNGMAESTGGNKKQQKNRFFDKSFERNSVKQKTQSVQTSGCSNKGKSLTPSPKTPLKNESQPVQHGPKPTKTIGMADSISGNKQQKNQVFEKSSNIDPMKQKSQSVQTPSHSNKIKPSLTPSPKFKVPVKSDNQSVQVGSSQKNLRATRLKYAPYFGFARETIASKNKVISQSPQSMTAQRFKKKSLTKCSKEIGQNKAESYNTISTEICDFPGSKRSKTSESKSKKNLISPRLPRSVLLGSDNIKLLQQNGELNKPKDVKGPGILRKHDVKLVMSKEKNVKQGGNVPLFPSQEDGRVQEEEVLPYEESVTKQSCHSSIDHQIGSQRETPSLSLPPRQSELSGIDEETFILKTLAESVSLTGSLMSNDSCLAGSVKVTSGTTICSLSTIGDAALYLKNSDRPSVREIRPRASRGGINITNLATAVRPVQPVVFVFGSTNSNHETVDALQAAQNHSTMTEDYHAFGEKTHLREDASTPNTKVGKEAFALNNLTKHRPKSITRRRYLARSLRQQMFGRLSRQRAGHEISATLTSSSDTEPLMGWLGKNTHDTEDDRLFPEEGASIASWTPTMNGKNLHETQPGVDQIPPHPDIAQLKNGRACYSAQTSDQETKDEERQGRESCGSTLACPPGIQIGGEIIAQEPTNSFADTPEGLVMMPSEHEHVNFSVMQKGTTSNRSSFHRDEQQPTEHFETKPIIEYEERRKSHPKVGVTQSSSTSLGIIRNGDMNPEKNQDGANMGMICNDFKLTNSLIFYNSSMDEFQVATGCRMPARRCQTDKKENGTSENSKGPPFLTELKTLIRARQSFQQSSLKSDQNTHDNDKALNRDAKTKNTAKQSQTFLEGISMSILSENSKMPGSLKAAHSLCLDEESPSSFLALTTKEDVPPQPLSKTEQLGNEPQMRHSVNTDLLECPTAFETSISSWHLEQNLQTSLDPNFHDGDIVSLEEELKVAKIYEDLNLVKTLKSANEDLKQLEFDSMENEDLQVMETLSRTDKDLKLVEIISRAKKNLKQDWSVPRISEDLKQTDIVSKNDKGLGLKKCLSKTCEEPIHRGTFLKKDDMKMKEHVSPTAGELGTFNTDGHQTRKNIVPIDNNMMKSIHYRSKGNKYPKKQAIVSLDADDRVYAEALTSADEGLRHEEVVPNMGKHMETLTETDEGMQKIHTVSIADKDMKHMDYVSIAGEDQKRMKTVSSADKDMVQIESLPRTSNDLKQMEFVLGADDDMTLKEKESRALMSKDLEVRKTLSRADEDLREIDTLEKTAYGAKHMNTSTCADEDLKCIDPESMIDKNPKQMETGSRTAENLKQKDIGSRTDGYLKQTEHYELKLQVHGIKVSGESKPSAQDANRSDIIRMEERESSTQLEILDYGVEMGKDKYSKVTEVSSMKENNSLEYDVSRNHIGSWIAKEEDEGTVCQGHADECNHKEQHSKVGVTVMQPELSVCCPNGGNNMVIEKDCAAERWKELGTDVEVIVNTSEHIPQVVIPSPFAEKTTNIQVITGDVGGTSKPISVSEGIGRDVSVNGSRDRKISVSGISGRELSVTGARGREISVSGGTSTEISVCGSRGREISVSGSAVRKSSVSRGADRDISANRCTGRGISASRIRGREHSVTGARGGEISVNGGTSTEISVTESRGREISVNGSRGREISVSGNAARKISVSGSTGKDISVSGITVRKSSVSGGSDRDISANRCTGRETSVGGSNSREISANGSTGREISVSGNAARKISVSGSAGKDISVSGITVRKSSVSGGSDRDISGNRCTGRETSVSGSNSREISANRSTGREISASGSTGQEVSVSGGRSTDILINGSRVREISVSGSRDREISISGSMDRKTSESGSIGRNISANGGACRDILVNGDAGREISANRGTGREISAIVRTSRDISASGSMGKEILTRGSTGSEISANGSTSREISSGSIRRDNLIGGDTGREISASGGTSTESSVNGSRGREISGTGCTGREILFSGIMGQEISVNGSTGREISVSGGTGREILVSGDTAREIPASGGTDREISVSGGKGRDISDGGNTGREISDSGCTAREILVSGSVGREISTCRCTGREISVNGNTGREISVSGGTCREISVSGCTGRDISDSGSMGREISVNGSTGREISFSENTGNGIFVSRGTEREISLSEGMAREISVSGSRGRKIEVDGGTGSEIPADGGAGRKLAADGGSERENSVRVTAEGKTVMEDSSWLYIKGKTSCPVWNQTEVAALTLDTGFTCIDVIKDTLACTIQSYAEKQCAEIECKDCLENSLIASIDDNASSNILSPDKDSNPSLTDMATMLHEEWTFGSQVSDKQITVATCSKAFIREETCPVYAKEELIRLENNVPSTEKDKKPCRSSSSPILSCESQVTKMVNHEQIDDECTFRQPSSREKVTEVIADVKKALKAHGSSLNGRNSDVQNTMVAIISCDKFSKPLALSSVKSDTVAGDGRQSVQKDDGKIQKIEVSKIKAADDLETLLVCGIERQTKPDSPNIFFRDPKRKRKQKRGKPLRGVNSCGEEDVVCSVQDDKVAKADSQCSAEQMDDINEHEHERDTTRDTGALYPRTVPSERMKDEVVLDEQTTPLRVQTMDKECILQQDIRLESGGNTTPFVENYQQLLCDDVTQHLYPTVKKQDSPQMTENTLEAFLESHDYTVFPLNNSPNNIGEQNTFTEYKNSPGECSDSLKTEFCALSPNLERVCGPSRQMAKVPMGAGERGFTQPMSFLQGIGVIESRNKRPPSRLPFEEAANSNVTDGRQQVSVLKVIGQSYRNPAERYSAALHDQVWSESTTEERNRATLPTVIMTEPIITSRTQRFLPTPREVQSSISLISFMSSDLDLSWADSALDGASFSWFTDSVADGNDNNVNLVGEGSLELLPNSADCNLNSSQGLGKSEIRHQSRSNETTVTRPRSRPRCLATTSRIAYELKDFLADDFDEIDQSDFGNFGNFLQRSRSYCGATSELSSSRLLLSKHNHVKNIPRKKCSMNKSCHKTTFSDVVSGLDDCSKLLQSNIHPKIAASLSKRKAPFVDTPHSSAARQSGGYSLPESFDKSTVGRKLTKSYVRQSHPKKVDAPQMNLPKLSVWSKPRSLPTGREDPGSSSQRSRVQGSRIQRLRSRRTPVVYRHCLSEVGVQDLFDLRHIRCQDERSSNSKTRVDICDHGNDSNSRVQTNVSDARDRRLRSGLVTADDDITPQGIRHAGEGSWSANVDLDWYKPAATTSAHSVRSRSQRATTHSANCNHSSDPNTMPSHQCLLSSRARGDRAFGCNVTSRGTSHENRNIGSDITCCEHSRNGGNLPPVSFLVQMFETSQAITNASNVTPLAASTSLTQQQ